MFHLYSGMRAAITFTRGKLLLRRTCSARSFEESELCSLLSVWLVTLGLMELSPVLLSGRMFCQSPAL